MSKNTLLVLCYDFPFKTKTAEANLLGFQIKVLKKIFRKIYIFPTAKLKTKHIYPNNEYLIDLRFRNFKIKSIFNVIKHLKYLIEELLKINFNQKFLKTFTKSLIFYLKGIHSFSFLDSFIKENSLNQKELMIYSFWFNEFSLGALLLKKNYPKLIVLTGAHGHDLFEERHYGERIPFREISISLIDKVYVCSKEGKDYLVKKYCEYYSKFELVNTGIKRKKYKVKFSTDDVLRIMTLSRTHPVKRISYLLNQLKIIEGYSKFKIQYFHIGGGKELESLKELNKSLKFKKFEIEFLGKLSDNELNNFFKSYHIDAFLNVSSSEGTSLALVEALSYSIPVIVTKVGGNISIGKSCGISLSSDFESKELYKAIKKLYYKKDFKELLGSKSHEYWLKNHDQEKIEGKIIEVFKKTVRS